MGVNVVDINQIANLPSAVSLVRVMSPSTCMSLGSPKSVNSLPGGQLVGTEHLGLVGLPEST